MCVRGRWWWGPRHAAPGPSVARGPSARASPAQRSGFGGHPPKIHSRENKRHVFLFCVFFFLNYQPKFTNYHVVIYKY